MIDAATRRLKRAAFEAERARKQARFLPRVSKPHDWSRSRYKPRADVAKAER